MAFFMSFSECVIEAETEEEDLVLDRDSPICPPMDSGAHMELMRDTFPKQLFMEITVDFIEEIFCPTINYQIKLPRLDKMGHVDDRVAFPVFRVVLICSQSF